MTTRREPWMPSDDVMVIESVRVYRMVCDRGDSVAVAENESCRAVARLAVESYRR